MTILRECVCVCAYVCTKFHLGNIKQGTSNIVAGNESCEEKGTWIVNDNMTTRRSECIMVAMQCTEKSMIRSVDEVKQTTCDRPKKKLWFYMCMSVD